MRMPLFSRTSQYGFLLSYSRRGKQQAGTSMGARYWRGIRVVGKSVR